MLFVENHHHDPAVNLALEEYLLRNAATFEDLLLFYINEPSIIIGRHQNTLEEINREYVEAHSIHVVRRLSGGGAVYHDLNNLNFSFITQYDPKKAHNFASFTVPVIEALHGMGVQAELSGRNDIVVDGRKVSGNAQYITAQRMYSHGTLLFNSDLSCVADALKVKADKIVSKGIKSVRSRVANISEFLAAPLEMTEFRQRILSSLFLGAAEIPQYGLTEADWQAIYRLADERYRSWDWNYGRSPTFNLQKTHRFPFGEIDTRIDVHNGLIRSIRLFGDFFSIRDIDELETCLTGVRYEPSALAAALEPLDLSLYFNGLSKADFVAYLY